jgi:hypothetical protein
MKFRNCTASRLARPCLARLWPALLAAAALGWLAAPAASAQGTPPVLPRVELGVGIHLIHAELARDEASRMLGLMYRRSLGSNDGMLFVFDAPAQHCMWMRNTYIPLSVAFLDASGAVINVEEMQAQTDDSHCALHPARYALEMGSHWFHLHGVRAGTVIRGVAGTPGQ